MRALRRSHASSSSPKPSPTPSSSHKPSSPPPLSWIKLVASTNSSPASSSSSSSPRRVQHKSLWSRRKGKHLLSSSQWRNFFTPEGKLNDGGVEFLKIVRSGSVDPSIRAEVWPFLLGVYDLTSSGEERDAIFNEKRKEYERLWRPCSQLLKLSSKLSKINERAESTKGVGGSDFSTTDCPDSEDVVSTRESFSSEDGISNKENADHPTSSVIDGCDSDSLDTDSSVDLEPTINEPSTSPQMEIKSESNGLEDFSTWQRIIRLDAIRCNGEWMSYSSIQNTVSDTEAKLASQIVGLDDYEHLDPARIFHAARLVVILEAYARYDPEIGYCQGMSDLLSPIITVMSDDSLAFWCFVGFMKKARHNFKLDEVGIRRQLRIVSKIIKHKDVRLYKHLEELQANDCFFVYRMVVVLFRRELTFEQTLCLWEVMWADQAAIRAGIGKKSWRKIRQQAPPTDDLLLYAIAASVLQRRKLIIEKYNSMDEILRECNSMAGHLDVWKLLDDAHNLVVTLHGKIESAL